MDNDVFIVVEMQQLVTDFSRLLSNPGGAVKNNLPSRIRLDFMGNQDILHNISLLIKTIFGLVGLAIGYLTACRSARSLHRQKLESFAGRRSVSRLPKAVGWPPWPPGLARAFRGRCG